MCCQTACIQVPLNPFPLLSFHLIMMGKLSFNAFVILDNIMMPEHCNLGVALKKMVTPLPSPLSAAPQHTGPHTQFSIENVHGG